MGACPILASLQDAWLRKEYRPVAAAIIRSGEGRTLFVQSAKSGREWHLPQGGIEPGEDAEEALFREIYEELGISEEWLSPPRFVGMRDLPADPRKGDTRGFAKGKRYFFFELRYGGPEAIRIDSAELADYKWTMPEEVDAVLITARKEKAGLMKEMLAKAA